MEKLFDLLRAGVTGMGLALVICLAGLAPAWGADAYPNRPIRLIVPFSAGGATDVSGRVLASEMSKLLGQPVIVENRPGAAGAVAADFVVASPADGYTLCFCGSGPTILLPLVDSHSKNYFEEMTPVTLVTLYGYVLVAGPSVPATSARELLDLIRTNPGKYSFGSSGSGNIQQLGMDMLASALGSRMVHVPYKGELPAIVDVAAGVVDMMISTAPNAEPLLKSGKIKAFATTGLEPHPSMPSLPTIESLGLPKFAVYTHAGINAPKGTPASVVDRLAEAVRIAAASPAMQKMSKDLGITVPPYGPVAYGDYVHSETAKWKGVMRAIDFKRE